MAPNWLRYLRTFGLTAMRDIWTATGISGNPNDGRGIGLTRALHRPYRKNCSQFGWAWPMSQLGQSRRFWDVGGMSGRVISEMPVLRFAG
jgi:hypothetical protein